MYKLLPLAFVFAACAHAPPKASPIAYAKCSDPPPARVRYEPVAETKILDAQDGDGKQLQVVSSMYTLDSALQVFAYIEKLEKLASYAAEKCVEKPSPSR